MADSCQFSMTDLPEIWNVSISMLERHDATFQKKLTIELTPDPDHLWLENFPPDQKFYIDLLLDPIQVDRFSGNVKAFHEFVALKVQDGWSAYWEGYFGINRDQSISVLNHPADQFVLGGAL